MIRDGTRWRTGGEVKGKLANGMCSQYPSHYLGSWCIQHYYRWCAHLGCQQSTELTPSGRFKWTSPFRRKTKSGFCACAITFQPACTFDLFVRNRCRGWGRAKHSGMSYLQFWHSGCEDAQSGASTRDCSQVPHAQPSDWVVCLYSGSVSLYPGNI